MKPRRGWVWGAPGFGGRKAPARFYLFWWPGLLAGAVLPGPALAHHPHEIPHRVLVILGKLPVCLLYTSKMKLYPGGRHEMLNERGKEQVYADVLNWCEEILRRLPQPPAEKDQRGNRKQDAHRDT